MPTNILPKSHLHLHLEGSARPETIRFFAHEDGVSLKGMSSYNNLTTFVPAYMLAAELINTPDRLKMICSQLVEDEKKENVKYLEPSFNPDFYAEKFGWTIEKSFDFLAEAFSNAAETHQVGIGYMIAADRSLGTEYAERIASWAAKWSEKGVVSFGIVGDEALNGPEMFLRAFEIARGSGLQIVPHAGETTGPENIWKAVRLARPDRIAHGVRAVEDPDLLTYLAEHQITCDVCITSNICLKVFDHISQHALPHMLRVGVPVTLNADDQLFFGSSISNEYEIAQRAFGLPLDVIAKIAKTSIGVSTMAPEIKRNSEGEIDRWLKTSLAECPA